MVVYARNNMSGGLNTLYRIKAAAGGAFTNTKSIESEFDGSNPQGTLLDDTTMFPSSQKIGTMSVWYNPLGNNAVNTYAFQFVYLNSDITVTRFINFYLTPSLGQFGFTDTFNSWSVLSNASGLTDADAWHNYLIKFDTTQATAANRVKVYKDGTEVTYEASPAYPPQNTNLWGFDDASATAQYWVTAYGEASEVGRPVVFDEIAFFDGQTYAYSDVSSAGVPKDLSGLTFGAMGFWHRFETGSAATVGNDSSGNGLNFANGGTTSLGTIASFANGDFLADVP